MGWLVSRLHAFDCEARKRNTRRTKTGGFVMKKMVLVLLVGALAGCGAGREGAPSEALIAHPTVSSPVPKASAIVGISAADRAELTVYEYDVAQACNISVMDSMILQEGVSHLTWDDVIAGADKRNAATAKQFAAIVAALKPFPDLVSAIKKHRDVVNDCSSEKMGQFATGQLNAERYKSFHENELNVAKARINTELDMIPMAPDSQRLTFPGIFSSK